MERAMSVEERIRKAEDIYNRRNGVYTKTPIINSKTKNANKKRTIKRLFMQIFVCLSIYVIFYAVTNREYIFSEDFRNSVNTFYTEKINTHEVYSKVKNFVLSFFEDDENNTGVVNEENANKEKGTEENKIDANQQENVKENQEGQQSKILENEQLQDAQSQGENKEKKNEQANVSKDENIGGAEESLEGEAKENLEESTENKKEKNKVALAKNNGEVSKKKDEELTEQEQMEKEAKEIKKNISFIAPIKGRISSSFGWRNPTTSTVPKYHTGVDIAAVEGTKIKSATDGKVIMASSAGDYGNHYQIQIQDVILVYAHCKKLYLKEGDIVKQGQEIAEVGSTGNSTGPHLHFEVRRNGKKIDPQLILDL
ncbi:MAG: peptidoglycan DD-metalloendopeptidase family protein [Clostridia bacterium]|nr:peptidoglycan DD-metalloendopeptidase family protein [Clostridia bacterium]